MADKWIQLTAGDRDVIITRSALADHSSDANYIGKVRKEHGRLIAAAPELLAACKRALPWIGKMIADGGHLAAVAPNDCVGAMQQLDAAILKATESAVQA